MICLLMLALAAPAPLAAAPVAVPPLAYTARTLPNGLRVFALPDKSGTQISVQVWYDVGSKDDPRGRSGFAHLFEHLMFKATRDLPTETIDRLTEDVGGANNASTDDDYTEYHEVAPANHLERLLFAEAQRMGALVVDAPSLASERDVVKEELRRNAARPYYGLFGLALPQLSYTTHPYARPGIGSIAELDAAALEDVRAFHALYYRPDNAVLVVAGNFDPRQFDQWVDRYFAPIARPSWPIPRVTVTEPARIKPARATLHAPNTPLPAVALSYQLPPVGDPDRATVEVVDAILSAGESSRLYRSLVYRDRVASEAGVYTDVKKGAGMMAVYALLAGGKEPAAAEAGLRREIAALRDAPVAPAELTRVKNQVVTGALKGRETAEGRAAALAQSVVVDGDPTAADRRLAAIQAVTAADVQRVARRIFPDTGALTITYLPAATGKGADPIALASTVVTAPLVELPKVPVVVAAKEGERARLPAPGPAVTPVLPVPIERRLKNGMRLVVIERPALPIVTAYLIVGGGSATDPSARAGLAELGADLLTKGTATRSAEQVAAAIESLGGGIGGSATRDGALLSLTVKSDQLRPAMDVFADVALSPAFRSEELERQRAQAIDGLSIAYASPGPIASMVASRLVFGDGPYGKPADGTPVSLKAITREDIVRAHDAAWRPDAATLVMAGDITADQAETLGNSLFGKWKKPAGPLTPPPAPGATPRPRVVVIDLPQSPQAAVLVARPTIARKDPRFYPMLVANATLGGSFGARLNQQVRVRRGLAYGANSSFDARRAPGPFAASTQTKNPSVPEVVELINGELRRMGSELVSTTELAPRKAALTGGFGRAIETTDGLAGFVAGLVLQEVPTTEIARYVPAIEAVTPAQVQEVAKALLDPAAASTVIVGDAGQFLPGLKAKGITPEVIPVAKLNLGKAELR